ncbi:glycosyltransferase, partial [Candidatus Parcubacteria bacterium]|nr:glycosyltransferase [Candidatus Parcubacteria bacterium]
MNNKKNTIAIDASRSIDSIQKTGVENVSDELIKEIEKLRKEGIEEFEIIYYTPKLINWLPEKNQKVLKWPFKFLWTQIRLSWEMLSDKPDIFFSPVHILPFFAPKNSFKIIHDVAFKKNNKIYNLKNKILLNLDLNRAIKKCKKIFVPSEQVKQDLLKYRKISENNIVVIPHGYTKKNTESLSAGAIKGCYGAK